MANVIVLICDWFCIVCRVVYRWTCQITGSSCSDRRRILDITCRSSSRWVKRSTVGVRRFRRSCWLHCYSLRQTRTTVSMLKSVHAGGASRQMWAEPLREFAEVLQVLDIRRIVHSLVQLRTLETAKITDSFPFCRIPFRRISSRQISNRRKFIFLLYSYS